MLLAKNIAIRRVYCECVCVCVCVCVCAGVCVRLLVRELDTDRSLSSASLRRRMSLKMHIRPTFGFGHKVLVEIRFRPNMYVLRPNVSPLLTVILFLSNLSEL